LEEIMHSTKILISVLIGTGVQCAAARDIKVEFGQSIQVAVDAASPGDRITIQPGVYREPGRFCPNDATKVCAVVVSKDDISLIGEPRPGQPVILESMGTQQNGITFARPGSDTAQCLHDTKQHIRSAKVSGFLVRNFDGSGIFMACVDDWTISSNIARDNKLYGIFPVLSSGGWINSNIVTGSHDTGIYVGQSRDVRVNENIAHDNVSGFEIENSQDVVLDHNESFNNTAGISVFILPGDVVMTSRNNRVFNNFVHDNNSPNTCIIPGDDVCLVPPGLGITVFAGDHNVIANNQVTHHRTAGIVLADACTALQLPPTCKLGFDPFPENTRIEFNTVEKSGFNPAPGFPGADLVWTGTGTGNCWLRNVASVSVPPQLPRCSKEVAEQ
jgi:parallel beta-helix repeat protein